MTALDSNVSIDCSRCSGFHELASTPIVVVVDISNLPPSLVLG